jgi:hypothetical protein
MKGDGDGSCQVGPMLGVSLQMQMSRELGHPVKEECERESRWASTGEKENNGSKSVHCGWRRVKGTGIEKVVERERERTRESQVNSNQQSKNARRQRVMKTKMSERERDEKEIYTQKTKVSDAPNGIAIQYGRPSYT